MSSAPLQFTGKERDTETGNDYFGARYYSSSSGRFLSPDWAARPTAVPYAVFGDPQSLNLYGYVRDDPVSQADADGHCLEDGCVAESIVLAYAIRAGVGFVLGAGAGAAGEAVHEYATGGHITIAKELHAAAGGGVTGAGASFGALGAIVGSVTGGGFERWLSHKKVLSLKAVGVDLGAGLLGGAADKEAEREIATPAIAKFASIAVGLGIDEMGRTLDTGGPSRKAPVHKPPKPKCMGTRTNGCAVPRPASTRLSSTAASGT